jgi:predicted ABC-type ATPase
MRNLICIFCFTVSLSLLADEPSKEAIYDTITKSCIEEIAALQPAPRFVLVMGGAACGKSTIRKLIVPKKTGVDVAISTDQIKEKLPEYQIGIKNHDPDIAYKVHKECFLLNKRIVKELFDHRFSFMVENTGSDFEYIKWLLSLAKEGKYAVSVYFVETDLEKAMERAEKRMKEIGRNVSPEMIKRSVALSKEHFLSLLPSLDQWAVFENSGSSPKIVWEKTSGADPVCLDSSYPFPVLALEQPNNP